MERKTGKEAFGSLLYQEPGASSKHKLKTIAFPNISTGVYCFPKALAAEIAISSVQEFLAQHGSVIEITFVLFDSVKEILYKKLIDY